MPAEPRRWQLKEYLRGQLEAIAPPDSWNQFALVRFGHVNIEELVGDAETPFASYQDDETTTVPEQRTFGQDLVEVTVSIRGYKKTNLIGVEWRAENEREAERLLQDIWRAVMQEPGMKCNLNTLAVGAPTRIYVHENGWVECVLTFIGTYQAEWLNP